MRAAPRSKQAAELPMARRRRSHEHRRAELTSAVRHAPPPPPTRRLLEARTHAHDAASSASFVAPWHAMQATHDACVAAGRLWRDPAFPHDCSSLAVADDGGSSAAAEVRWLSLSELYGEPHVWLDGRSSFLYAYGRHAKELPDALPPGDAIQGSLGDCFLLSAVAVAMRDSAVRRDLIDETLEAAGIYG
eukprot:6355329-Prymnesium_polylepis.1